MSVFDTALSTLLGDPNVGVDIVYHPAIGTPIPCRAALVAPDLELRLASTRVKDQKILLQVRTADVPQPATNDTVTIAACSAFPTGASLRVLQGSVRDPMRLTVQLELALQ